MHHLLLLGQQFNSLYNWIQLPASDFVLQVKSPSVCTIILCRVTMQTYHRQDEQRFAL